MKLKNIVISISLLLLFQSISYAQLKTDKIANSGEIAIGNEKDLELKKTTKSSVLKPNLGGQPVVPIGNTVILFPGNYATYLWQNDGSTNSTVTIGGEGQCCNKVTVTDGTENTGEDQVSVTIRNPKVGFYNIEREQPYSCSDVIRLQAYNYCDAGGYIVPGFAISVRTDENSLAENKMVFLRNGKKYAEEGIGRFTNDSKHYINLQYITPSDKWEYAFVDKGKTGEFHSVSQDNADWSMIERKMLVFSQEADSIGGYLGYAKGKATFSGPGVVNHKNGYGRFYAQLAGPGTHTITYTWNDGRGFEGSASQTITVADNLAVINAGEDTEICKGKSVVLGGNPTGSGGVEGYEFQWEPAEGLDDPYAANPVATPLETTTYIGMLADKNGYGCVVSDTITVVVNELEHNGIEQNDTTICLGESLLISTENSFSFDFDGNDDHIYVKDHDALDLTTQGTVEAWIFPHSYQPFGGIIHKGDRADWWDEAYTLQLWNDKKIKFAVIGEGESNKNILMLSSVKDLALDEWHHIAGVWDETGVKLYIDGILDNSITETKVARISNGGLNIGTQLNENYNDKLKKVPFKGLIDEARVWNRALSAQEIAQNMQKLLKPNEEIGLVAYFGFNEGVGETTSDLTDNQFIGKILEPKWSTFIPFNQSAFTYSWNLGQTEPNIIVNPSESSYYYLTISDEKCSKIDSIFVEIGQSTNQNISGTVSYSEGKFLENELIIKAYKLPDYLLTEQAIDYNSSYNLNLEQGKYILRAVLNNAKYPDVINTYYDSTYSYKLAKIIELNCGENYVANFKMFETEPIPTKSNLGKLSGTIHYSSAAKTNTIEITKNTSKSGNLPVIGAIVTAEVENSYKPLNISETSAFGKYLFHSPKAYGQSDINGYYEITGLEFGNYALQVNIPGLELNSTHELIIDENSQVNYNLNFIVGAGISADYSTTDVEIFDNYNFSLNIFPNPTTDKIKLDISLKDADYLQYRVLNSAGQLIYASDKKQFQSGNYTELINLETQGIFYLEIQIGNTVCVKKVIKQ